jgi:uncharacterized protein YraI
MKRTIVVLALAAGLAGPTTSLASEALTAVNVRSGPGSSFGVVDTLSQGEEVDVLSCRSSGWCAIEHDGPDGYVFSRYLSADVGLEASVEEDVVIIDDGPANDDLDVRSRLSVAISVGFGDGFRMRDGRRSDRDLVCLVTFYRRGQVEAGADADVRRADLLPAREAERLDRPNDRRRIFDYGSNRENRETCRYLDRLNN